LPNCTILGAVVEDQLIAAIAGLAKAAFVRRGFQGNAVGSLLLTAPSRRWTLQKNAGVRGFHERRGFTAGRKRTAR
jgi:hypothetical protein